MRNDRPGVALMLVLWLVVVLGVTAAAVVARSRSEAMTVAAYRSRATARAAASSGVELTVARLRRAYGEASGPRDQVAALHRLQAEMAREGALPLGGGRFQVALVDLTGRIPINDADYPTLIRLFTLAAGPARAPALTAATLDWIDPDDTARPSGAEAAEYEEAGSPYRPLNRPFQRIEEVARVLGVDDSVTAVLAGAVSVHGSGLINVNSASPVALAAATGMDLRAAERVVAARGDRPFAGMDEVRSAIGSGAGFVPVTLVPTRLLVVSRGWAAGRPYSREIRAVVELRDWAGPRGPRLALVGWEERDR